MDGPGIRPVDNETVSQTSRKSKEGKTLTYKLHVLQQPARARACGSGAKSSADRRPVDPPPIVELKIFEGEGGENELKDVTFSLNSNFFLFASLEQARNITHGRVSQDHKSPPVLTGSPVAGMVYLDRPNPAGYFIFPDLSVRHEGKYRVTFSLFEEVKEIKDEDQDDESAKRNGHRDGYVSQRLEVKSQPFTVYSAKKFPGLAESTSLSRIVAEQGCRVRIRRDVRMRRRSDKPTKDWDGYEDDTAEARGRMSATPEAAGHYGHSFMEPVARPRSSSNASHPSLAPSLSRRPSLQDVNQGFQQPSYAPAPQTPQTAYPQSSSYVTGLAPNPAYAHPPYIQHQSTMQPPSAYQPTHPQQPNLPQAPTQQPQYGYGPPPPISVPAPQVAASPASYEAGGHPQRPSVDYSPQRAADPRRSSTMYAQPAPQVPAGYPQAPAYPTTYPVQHSHHSSFGTSDAYNRPAPAEPVQPPTRTSGTHTPLQARPFNDKLPPLNTTFNMSGLKPLEPSSPAAMQQASYYNAAPPVADTNKRNYAQVFSERHLSQPLRHGARPSPSNFYNSALSGIYSQADDEPVQDLDSDLNDNPVKMIYRRADGRQVNRNLPPHD